MLVSLKTQSAFATSSSNSIASMQLTILLHAVSFQEEGMQFVDLAERPILARYAAVGQMNFVPGVWDPT